MTVRVTYHFGYRGAGLAAGFSEVHWRISDSDVSQSVAPAIELAQKRVKLFASNIDLYLIRLSREEKPRQSHRIISSILSATANTTTMPTMGDPLPGADKAEKPNSSIIMTGKHQDFRTRTFYLAGHPDLITRTDPAGPDLNAVPGYNAAMVAWRDILLNGTWGFRARVLEPDEQQIAGLSNEADGLGRVKVKLPVGETLGEPGNIVQIRGAKPINRALGTINGQWVAEELLVTGSGPTAVTELLLRNSAGTPASNFNPMGTIEGVEYTYLPYTKIEISGQGTRKRGVGSVRRRGRSKRPVRRL